jgi:hypothetical protein
MPASIKAVPEIYPIAQIGKGKLSIMPCPPGNKELKAFIFDLKSKGVGSLLCLLATKEQAELGLKDEEKLCNDSGIGYQSFPIIDFGLPDLESSFILARNLITAIQGGESLVIHCRAGIGRSSIIAATVLIMAGFTAEAALDLIAAQPQQDIPDTKAQSDWVFDFQSYAVDQIRSEISAKSDT